MLLGIVMYVRVIGLRSFSKMSAFDFVVTVAYGSLLASTTLSESSLVDGLVAAASLLAIQYVIALGRSRTTLSRVVDNRPLLLMRDGRFLEDNLRRARVTTDDVRAKLRAANVCRLEDVQAVVLETTGDVSVLHGAIGLDAALLDDVGE
jgi:uncharacterized membrane protein YcaP (DUF421 family)